MTGMEKYKSKVGEIFVYFGTVELLLGEIPAPGRSWSALSLTVTGQVCPMLISEEVLNS